MANDVALAFRVAANLAEFRKNMQEAQAQLETTKTAMRNMANGFDGSRIIANGNAMVKVIHDLGGASTLTASEQLRVNSVLTEAIAKYQAMGRVAPPSMVSLANATKQVTPAANDLHLALGRFDNLLATMGIHIGNEVKGLGELSTAVGTTASQLGTLTTIGLSVAAALGGWKIGRLTSEFFDLDEKIGDAAARLLGFGDVAAEKAAAKADVLARASKIAGIEITSFSLAMELNQAAAQYHAEALNTSANRIAGWEQELARVRSSGNFGLLTQDIESQNFDLKELADRYHLSVDAIQYYVRETKKAADAVEEANKRKLDALREEVEAQKDAARQEAQAIEQVTRLWDEYNTLRISHGGTATDVQMAQVKQWADDLTARMKKLGGDTREFYDALAAVSAEKMESIRIDWKQYSDYSRAHLQEVADREQALYQEMLLHAGEFTRGAIEHQRQVVEAAISDANGWTDPWEQAFDAVSARSGQTAAKIESDFDKAVRAIEARQRKLEQLSAPSSLTYDLSTPEGMAQFRKLNPAASVGVDSSYFKDHTLQQAIAAGLVNLYAGYTQAGLPHFAGGVTNFGGGLAVVGERGPELVRLPAGSDVIPNGAGTVTVVNTININGTVIGDDRGRIAAEVGDAIMARFRSLGMRFAASRVA